METPRTSERNSMDRKYRRRAFLWDAFLSVLFLWWGFSVLRAPWGSLKPMLLPAVAVSAAVWCCCVASDAAEKAWHRWVLLLGPWIMLLPWVGVIRQGLLLWFNCVLNLWNQEHQSAWVFFRTAATTESVMACSMAASVALGQLVQRMVAHRRRVLCGVSGLALALLQLLTGTFTPFLWGVWIGAFLGLWLSREEALPGQLIRIWAVGTAILLLCALPGAGDELEAVTRLRTGTAQAVRQLRYGSDPLPAGDLSAAAKLNRDNQEVLQVSTEQEKSLYLRAFVGADYTGGRWQPLPDSAYGGTYSGMLRWLENQGFDPLTQSASYYALSDPDTAPEKNTLSIRVTGGTRAYLYVPASAGTLSVSSTEQKDQRMRPRGLRGADSYSVEEYSSDRPAELTLWADWVAEPETAEQERYVQAEKMYRSFVYDNYTQTDAELQPTIEKLFWEDYQTENDGVYSALEQIRNVLSRYMSYTQEPDTPGEGVDALQDFLTGSRRGNAVLYASAAVEALRARGIPARYVEGYYVSSADVAESENGLVSLTGQNAHAWAEVYFDGVGWLPLDVTPGYYYDAVTLRQMVALPDTVKKTAALDGGAGGGEDVIADTEVSKKPGVAEVVRDTALLMLGLAALAILAATVWFVGGRLRRIWQEEQKKRLYLRADAKERTRLLKCWIYEALAAAGVDACLGWKTAETDAAVAERFQTVEPGEYSRVVELLEKFRYGGTALELFELRVLETFLKKVTA